MRWLIAAFVLIPNILFAQKWIGPDSSHPIDQRQAALVDLNANLSNDTASIKDWLLNNLTNLKRAEVGLKLTDFKQSPKAKHYRFAQTLNGRTVFRGSVKLNVANNGHVLSLFDNTFAVNESVDASFPSQGPYHEGLMVHYNEPGNGRLDHYDLQEVYFPVDGELQPAIHLEVVEQTDRYYELVLNKDVMVIYQNDLLSYASPQDSTVTVWVFNPDPLTTANQTYGAPYVDNADNDAVELNAERIPVEVTATYDAGTFSLANDRVAIQEFSSPVVQPVTSVVPEFNFTRSESGFEDVNAFYHITNFQQYIQSLGFNDIVDYQIAVDVHALNGADNSNFNAGFDPARLQFGEGGVDDAEDADVIIHEYGHAISHSAAPNTNTGTQRKALDEAIGDYFASSYSRFLSPNRWQDVFTWDGHNQYWNGRSSVSSDHYPEDLDNNLYADADIWSATLMQIWGDIGREATDAIMIQANYSFASNMTMPQAAMLFLQADTLLFNGAYFTPIHQRMYERGLIPWLSGVDDKPSENQAFEVYNTVGFTTGKSPVRIVSKEAITANLFNAVGQLLLTETSGTGNVEVNSNGLDAGIYLLEVDCENTRSTIKLVKQ